MTTLTRHQGNHKSDCDPCDHCGRDGCSGQCEEDAAEADEQARIEEYDRLCELARLASLAAEPANDQDERRKGDPRPIIRVSPDLADVVDEAVSALAARARDLGVYQRGHRLVHLTAITPEEADASPVVSVSVTGEKRRELVAGMTTIHLMEVATTRELLTRCAKFEKHDARTRKWRHCIPGDPVVHAVQARKKWHRVPYLVGVAETPFLRPDGSICQTPGFDAATGFVFSPSCKFPAIPDQPTQDEARKAYAELAEVYADFPFASDSHRAIPIAATLTIEGRPAIDGPVPAYGFDGNVRGAGKSLLTDTIAMQTTSRPMPRKPLPPSEEELDKVLGCYAVDGTPFFSIDNIDRTFGGGCLDAALTGRDLPVRILGKTKQVTVPWRAVMFFTGNNLQLRGDIADRVLIGRLESPDENPRRRPASAFRHPDLLAWLRQKGPRLVVAGLTILRAYFVYPMHEPRLVAAG